jgi:hypothetical protein
LRCWTISLSRSGFTTLRERLLTPSWPDGWLFDLCVPDGPGTAVAVIGYRVDERNLDGAIL